MKTSALRYLFVISIMALLPLPLVMAQTVTGSITGIVTDPSGAVVVGANVVAGNTATGVKTTAQTNGAGAYTIRFLPIGTYAVSVNAKGFTPAQVQAFALEIDQTAKINVELKIGTSETTVVTATEHPILDTGDASLGNTLSTNEIANIPLNGRNFSQLTLFEPGSVDTDPTGMTGNNAIERNTYNSGVAAINGNREQANNYTIEGADDNEPQNNLIGYNPAPDAIQEVRVVSGNANATYGNANGGAVVTVLKSGTNSYHGSLYEFLQSQILDANTWGNNHNATAIPKNPYTQNIFGGTIGGPIVKNRLFFFGDYEGIRHHVGGKSSASVLTQAMRGGDFSVLLNPVAANQSSAIQLYDTQNNFTPYAGNLVPIANPVAQYLFAHTNLYPLPNTAPTAGQGPISNNYQGAQSTFISNNQEDFKVDWTPSDANRLNGFYSQGTGTDFTTPLIPVFFPAHNRYPTKIGGASFVHTFSPYIVNEFRFGFTRVRWINGVPSDPSGQFGLTGDSKVGIPFGTQKYVGFTGQSVTNASYLGTNANPQVFTDNTFNYQDNLTWQRGRHYLSIGGQAVRYQQNYLNAGNVGFLGQFSYNGIYTESLAAANGPGYGPADFVLGRIQNVQLASPLGWVGNRQWRIAGYLQDDLKLTTRLTFNLGIRYEYDQPWYEQNDKTANVVLSGSGPIVEYAGHVPALAVPGSKVCPTRACYDGNYKQFMPRLGFAYQPFNKLVVRGGYGATSFFEGYSFNQRLTSSPPFSLAINSSATAPSGSSGGTPFSVTNAFNQPLGVNNSLYSVWPQDTQPAYIHQFTLVTEYALTDELSLSAGYHGQIGHHLADYRNGNQLTTVQAFNISTTGGCGASSIPAADQPPYFALVGECNPILITESQARMTYNAAQVTLRQRTHRGLEYTLNYTFAKSLTDSSGNYAVSNTSFNGLSHQDGYNINADYGPSAMDIRHSLNFVGVYELPFGRGRAYGNSANGVVDGVLGGWKVATSAILYSGVPVTIFANGNSNTNSWGFSRANQYRNMVIKNRTVENWWGADPSALPCLTAGVDDGTCAYGNPGSFTFGNARNSTERAPGYRQVDMSLFKDFHVWREQVVGFRADFFNVFNIASYGNPDNNINDGTFGVINSVRSPARSIQLSLHYMF